MKNLMSRMIRAAKLDVSVYEEVEADKSTFNQSVAVVVLSSIAAGVGTPAPIGLGTIIAGTIGALIGWFVWSFITFFIGTKLLPEEGTKATYGELLRTIGFSSSPGLLRFLALITPLAPIVFFVTGIWMLVAMVVAVKQALDYKSTGRAIGVCIIGWLFQVMLLSVIFALLAPVGA